MPTQSGVAAATGARSQSDQPDLTAAGDRFADWSGDRFLGKIQPILASRCAACHGCTSSPCSLKLDSFGGLQRGANATDFYSVHAKSYATPYDGLGAEGFFQVVKAGKATSGQDLGILHQFIKQGYERNQTSGTQKFNAANSREQLRSYDESYGFQCPATPAAATAFLKAKPALGMPLGLPGLSDDEYAAMDSWLRDGAPGPSATARIKLTHPSNPAVIAEWERFLNDSSPKGRLVGRYIYEHSYSAHYHFDEMPGEFFRLVRSVVAPNESSYEPPEEIFTELPTDDPRKGVRSSRLRQGQREQTGHPVFFYRFQKVDGVVTRKNHIQPGILAVRRLAPSEFL